MGQAADIIELSHRLPTHDEIESAADAAGALAAALRQNGALEIAASGGDSIRLAPAITALLIDVLSHVARGNMLTLVPTGALLTTQQAADILNVSRPFLSQLLKEGVIPFIPIGSHRRVSIEALLKYKDARDANQLEALHELSCLGQEFDAS